MDRLKVPFKLFRAKKKQGSDPESNSVASSSSDYSGGVVRGSSHNSLDDHTSIDFNESDQGRSKMNSAKPKLRRSSSLPDINGLYGLGLLRVHMEDETFKTVKVLGLYTCAEILEKALRGSGENTDDYCLMVETRHHETIFKDDDDPALEMLDVDVGKVRIKRKTDRDLLEDPFEAAKRNVHRLTLAAPNPKKASAVFVNPMFEQPTHIDSEPKYTNYSKPSVQEGPDEIYMGSGQRPARDADSLARRLIAELNIIDKPTRTNSKKGISPKVESIWVSDEPNSGVALALMGSKAFNLKRQVADADETRHSADAADIRWRKALEPDDLEEEGYEEFRRQQTSK